MIIIQVEDGFEAWKIKPIVINQWAQLYNDTFIRLRREHKTLNRKNVTANELCWLAYARFLDMSVAPDEIVFDAGNNLTLAQLANLWFGDDSVLFNNEALNQYE